MPWLPVLLAAALMLGVATGATFPAVTGVAAGAAVAAWAATALGWRTGGAAAVLTGGLSAVAASGAVLGGVAMQRALSPTLVLTLAEHGVLRDDEARGGSPVRLAGRLLTDASPGAQGVLMRIAVTRVWVGGCGCPETVDGQILASVGGAAAGAAMHTWRAGRTVELTAALRRPLAFRNRGAPDPAIDLARRRAVLLASVKSAFVVRVVARGNVLSEAAGAVRARARQAIAAACGRATEAAAIATAVLIGDRAGLDVALEERLERAGTFHVIAISGGNIALWSLTALWLSGRLTRRRPVALAAAALALVGYAGVVGGGASVMRATGMALVGIATRWLDQRGAAINVLALTAAALAVADPIVVFDVGFWLTTAATAGLVLGVPAPSPGESRVAVWTRALVLTSVWAEAALLPIAATVFQQVTLAGVVLSAVAIPAMAVVQVAALAAVVADALVPALLVPCGWLLIGATSIVTHSARLVEMAPWLAWRVPPPSFAVVAVYYAAVAAWLWARRPAADTRFAVRLRQGSRVVAPAAAAWIALSPLTLLRWPDGALHVTVLDVGQGDAVLVQFPNGRRMLVDAGGASANGRDVGARVVGPTLRARGIRTLDYLVVTHADLDHIGGAATIVREFAPLEVWAGIPVADDDATAELQTAARAHGAAWREVVRGTRLTVGDVRVAVLHPPQADWERQRVRNDDSVVLALDYGATRVLLTGDIGAAVEADVVAAIDTGDPPPLTVLKVAHHGSAGSTGEAWLASVRPALAIVSAGATNPFGHPAPAVLTRLATSGADVWRTDRDGEVSMRSNGRAVEVSSYTGRRRWLTVQPR